MKKQVIVSVFIAAIATLWQSQSFAQSGGGGGSIPAPVPADELSIGGQDIVREYLLGKAVRGSRYVWSESMDWNYSDRLTSVEADGSCAEAVLAKLFAGEFQYRLTNPDDTVYGYVYLYDAEDNLLFYGNAQYTAADLKEGKPAYTIWMQQVPLLTGVESAEVLALDEDGHTANRYSLSVEDGQLFFSPWMAGAPNGLPVVRFLNGSVATFSLADPVSRTPSGVDEPSASYKIDGHYVLSVSGEGSVDITEAWTRPTVHLTVESAAETVPVRIDVTGLVQDRVVSFERPYAVEVLELSSGLRSTVLLSTEKPSELLFKPGAYRLLFKWFKFGEPGMLYTGPSDGIKG